MQYKIGEVSRSLSAKVLLIGLMIMLLLIPVSMIKDVINDRQRVSNQAERDIMQSWGGRQVVAAPYLVLPYEYRDAIQYGSRLVTGKRIFVLPDTLDIEVVLDPQIRYRGIHEVPVYNAQIRFSGIFSIPDSNELRVDASQVDWNSLLIAVGISDARAVLNTPVLSIGNQTVSFAAGGLIGDELLPQIIAAIQNPFDEEGNQQVAFSFEMNLNGTRSLNFLPLGDTTHVAISSSWSSPSFSGAYLPVERVVSDDGFDASWEISSLGRSIPSLWHEGELSADAMHQSVFGVDIFMPVGLYQLSLRATKYAVLFIGLTFVAYFLFEVMAGLRLHLMQYLMIGFANTLFYLLLLSLAEHIGFGWSYIVSALASASLIVGYSKSALEYRYQAGLVSVVMLCLYSFLYMTLRAETYALLFGSIGLWVSLAIIMFLTRRVDWFRGNSSEPSAQ